MLKGTLAHHVLSMCALCGCCNRHARMCKHLQHCILCSVHPERVESPLVRAGLEFGVRMSALMQFGLPCCFPARLFAALKPTCQ